MIRGGVSNERGEEGTEKKGEMEEIKGKRKRGMIVMGGLDKRER